VDAESRDRQDREETRLLQVDGDGWDDPVLVWNAMVAPVEARSRRKPRNCLT
jgi:hypothetical protein